MQMEGMWGRLGWCVLLLTEQTWCPIALEKLWCICHGRAVCVTEVPGSGSVAVPLQLTRPSSTECTCTRYFACRMASSSLPSASSRRNTTETRWCVESVMLACNFMLSTATEEGWPHQHPRPQEENQIRPLLPLQPPTWAPGPWGCDKISILLTEAVKIKVKWKLFCKLHIHIHAHTYTYTVTYVYFQYTALLNLNISEVGVLFCISTSNIPGFQLLHILTNTCQF